MVSRHTLYLTKRVCHSFKYPTSNKDICRHTCFLTNYPERGHAASAVPGSVSCSLRPSPPTPPTLYVFNAASIAKPKAIELLTTELSGYCVDIAVICETHLKKKHADSAVNIDGYALFRHDRCRTQVRRRRHLYSAVV